MTLSDVQATFCATLLDEWCRAGVVHAVVCPGSRSTPMALAIAAEPRLSMHVVLDERSAAFFAVGLGRATGKPAVLLCTSGTAAVEFHPAVVEAHLDRVPMLVVTADRPPDLHGIGAPQTVDQSHLYGRSTRAFFEPGVADNATAPAWRSLAARAVIAAVGGVDAPGPVHLNLAFREPLVGKARRLPVGRPKGQTWHRMLPDGNADTGMSVSLSRELLDTVNRRLSRRRGIVVAGAGSGDPVAVRNLALALNWPLLADPRSGARGGGPGGPGDAGPVTVAHADAILRSAGLAQDLRPEVVLRLGAPWSSKVLNLWLATVPNDVLVDPYRAWLDPNRASSLTLAIDPSVLCRLLAHEVEPVESGWARAWARVDAAARLVVARQLDDPDGPVSEPAIVRAFSRSVPTGSQVVVSSSMPVRDLEWFGADRSDVVVFANRGANGIDGVVSTALGVAAAATGPTFALIGDLAFLHDAGALVLAAQHRSNCTFLVIDNAGGGIFEFLPQATSVERSKFEALYGTPQIVDPARLAQAHGLRVSRPRSLRALTMQLRKSAVTDGVSVIVMRTDRRENVTVHDQLNQAVLTAAESAAHRRSEAV